MKRFQQISVAVDLASGDELVSDELVSDELVPPSQESVAQAIWLAGHSGAELLFLYALDLAASLVELNGAVLHVVRAGMLMGNTAERLLPQIDCSLLAVKPADFVGPFRVPS